MAGSTGLKLISMCIYEVDDGVYL